MGDDTLQVVRGRNGWTVRLRDGEAVRVFRYGSEQQARFFAAVFRMGPPTLPAHEVHLVGRRRGKVARRRRAESSTVALTTG